MKYEASALETSILWNNGGNYTLQPLPLEAQMSPVFGIVIDDLDGDNKNDIWLGGNLYAVKPQVGRYNASKGVFLKQVDGKKFEYISPSSSGITVSGEVRDAVTINSKPKKRFS